MAPKCVRKSSWDSDVIEYWVDIRTKGFMKKKELERMSDSIEGVVNAEGFADNNLVEPGDWGLDASVSLLEHEKGADQT